MKLFKSLSRKERGAKRERLEESAEDNAKRVKSSEDASASASPSGEAHTPPGSVFRPPASDASFITSSIRKSTARRTGSGGAAAEPVAPTNLSTRFGGDGDDGPTSLGVDVLGSPKVKITRSGSRKLLDTIFSPMFSFFSSGGTRKQGRRPKTRRSAKREVAGQSEHADAEEAILDMKMSKIHNALIHSEDLDGKDVELLGGERMSAREYLGRFGMTSEEAAHAPYEDYDEEYDPWAFIYNLRYSSPSAAARGPKGPVLPARDEHDTRNTLVLDLDETLVHSNLENTVERCDFSFPVVFNGDMHRVNVRKRPHLSTFMELVSKQYEIVVFTASQQIYADKLLDILDPSQKWIKHRVFRDSCVQIDGNFMKDLRVLGRDLSRTIIIDNSPQAFGLQVENGIPIESWYDDDADNHLLSLLPVLNELAADTDVRVTLDRMFNLRERVRRGGLRSDAWRQAMGIEIGAPLPPG
jgi:CTD small phosphatase-like protein 2